MHQSWHANKFPAVSILFLQYRAFWKKYQELPIKETSHLFWRHFQKWEAGEKITKSSHDQVSTDAKDRPSPPSLAQQTTRKRITTWASLVSGLEYWGTSTPTQHCAFTGSQLQATPVQTLTHSLFFDKEFIIFQITTSDCFSMYSHPSNKCKEEKTKKMQKKALKEDLGGYTRIPERQCSLHKGMKGGDNMLPKKKGNDLFYMGLLIACI